jgi:Domain of unknown function (DUF4357)
MTFGKTIKIFLLEGDPNGRMSCELSNWTGKAYKIPRILVADCHDRADLSNTGVYLLFGKSDAGQDKVYIGEAESVLPRLKQHIGQKEFWVECIVFVSKDENLNKAHVKYLENKLYEWAKKTGRYELENSNIPTQSAISESDRAEMEEFLANIRLLVSTLGHKVFEEKREVSGSKNPNQKTVFIKGVRNAEAQGQRTTDGFLVFKGSKASKEVMPSSPKYILTMRQRLIEEAVLTEEKETLLFKEDYIFGSPSTASMLIFGRPSNGLEEWKDAKGVTLKKIEAEEAKDESFK